ncbi:hypothetical protein HZA39_01840 [Candidatus Peregrinibacteria bacterium]|nr:hypothetical protein [Candidatus Peregrinibacteria bacterium]
MPEDSFVSFTIVQLTDSYAVLKNQDENIGNILWPLNKLPSGARQGDEIKLGPENKGIHTEQQYQMMRKLLEDLVN